MKAIINVNIYDFGSYRENQYILYDKKIIKVDSMSEYTDEGYEVIDGENQLLMPSLVNAHAHIYSTFARGLILDFNPTNFIEILEQMWWKLDSKLNNESVYSSGIVHGIDTVQNGVTTIIDHHASGIDIIGSLKELEKSICKDIGLRGIFCFETSDRFDVEDCINENISFSQSIDTDQTMTSSLFGAHAAMTLSDETLSKIPSMPIHIHVAESIVDEKDSRGKHNSSVVERLDSFGLLEEDSILAHCLYINDVEAKLIKEHNCYVVLNVTSNMNNGVGLPDYDLLKKYDIPVLIGNDGISSSITTEWLNLYYTMHHKNRDILAFGLDDLLEIIQNNYEYASRRLGCKLGRIEPGFEADMLLIPYTPPTKMNSDNGFGHIFFGLANSFKPKNVWCNGKQLVNDYKVSNELETKYREAKEISNKLWERLS